MKWRRGGDSNPRYPFEVRRFSKALLSTTQPPLQNVCATGRERGFYLARNPPRGKNLFASGAKKIAALGPKARAAAVFHALGTGKYEQAQTRRVENGGLT